MKISDLKIAIARKKLLALNENSTEKSGNRKMGIILDTDDEKTFQSFLLLKRDLQLEQEHFHLIFCRERTDKNTLFDTPLISRKDFGWNGRSSEAVSAFLNADYDVLICFTSEENKMADFIVSVTRARLKVGRKKEDKKGVFDLNISAELSSPEIFKTELKKYLKILIQQ